MSFGDVYSVGTCSCALVSFELGLGRRFIRLKLDEEETPYVATGPPPPSMGQQIIGHQTESEKRVSGIAVETLLPFFEADGFVSKCLDKVSICTLCIHVMSQ